MSQIYSLRGEEEEEETPADSDEEVIDQSARDARRCHIT